MRWIPHQEAGKKSAELPDIRLEAELISEGGVERRAAAMADEDLCAFIETMRSPTRKSLRESLFAPTRARRITKSLARGTA